MSLYEGDQSPWLVVKGRGRRRHLLVRMGLWLAVALVGAGLVVLPAVEYFRDMADRSY
jgi:hypothetical protein